MTDPISVEAELQDPQRIDAEHAAETVPPDEAIGLSFSLDRQVARVLSSLTPKERKIVERRLGLTDESPSRKTTSGKSRKGGRQVGPTPGSQC